MKKIFLTLAIPVLASATIFTSCNSSAEKVDEKKENVEDAQKDLDEAKLEYTKQYNQFKLESDEKITTNEKLIADLKEYSKNKKKEAKIEYEKTIANLEEQNQDMKERIEDYQDQGNEKWESFKDEFNHDMNKIGEALRDLTTNNSK